MSKEPVTNVQSLRKRDGKVACDESLQSGQHFFSKQSKSLKKKF